VPRASNSELPLRYTRSPRHASPTSPKRQRVHGRAPFAAALPLQCTRSPPHASPTSPKRQRVHGRAPSAAALAFQCARWRVEQVWSVAHERQNPWAYPEKAQNRSFAKNSARTTARGPKTSSQRHVLTAIGLTCDDTFRGRANFQRNRLPGQRLRVTTPTGPSFRTGGPGFLQNFQQPQPRIVGGPT
jgi:hypothetical protein